MTSCGVKKIFLPQYTFVSLHFWCIAEVCDETRASCLLENIDDVIDLDEKKLATEDIETVRTFSSLNGQLSGTILDRRRYESHESSTDTFPEQLSMLQRSLRTVRCYETKKNALGLFLYIFLLISIRKAGSVTACHFAQKYPHPTISFIEPALCFIASVFQ